MRSMGQITRKYTRDRKFREWAIFILLNLCRHPWTTRPRYLMNFRLRYIRYAFLFPGVNSRAELVPPHGASCRCLGDNCFKKRNSTFRSRKLFFSVQMWKHGTRTRFKMVYFEDKRNMWKNPSQSDVWRCVLRVNLKQEYDTESCAEVLAHRLNDLHGYLREITETNCCHEQPTQWQHTEWQHTRQTYLGS